MPTKQRALTPAEYTALGYVQRSDFDKSMFNVKPDEPLSTPFIDIAYRAEEKEDYYIDLAIGLAKLGYAASTGGVVPAAKTTLGYVVSLL
jgi:hypothetical protein